MKHCKSVLSVIVVIALIVSTIMIGNTGPFAEGGDQGYPVPELFPEVNRFMDEDEKKTIVSRIDGYGDALNTILYKTVSGEVMGIFYPLDVKYLDGDYVKDKSNKLYESESNGHYVLVTGIYTNSDGNRRLVIADPHYNAVASGSSQTYAMLDIPFSSYYYTYKHSSAVIRNELW